MRRPSSICETERRFSLLGSSSLDPTQSGGEDTINNAAALCPNCHREVHHGKTNEGQ
ncbi:MAG: HNH endonuclease [Verrucomicrobiales bacterium]|nr:HNH endonuclease [Verrucomicrobiales bacterium]